MGRRTATQRHPVSSIALAAVFLRALTITTLGDELELPGSYNSEAACRLEPDGVPAVLHAAATHTRTETKAMRDPTDSDEDRGRRLHTTATVTREAGRDRDADAPTLSVALTATKTAGGRDIDRPHAGLVGTETRGQRDRD